MATACIVIADTNDGQTVMSVVFDGGYDNDSPAHAAMRRVLQHLDSLGMDICEPIMPDESVAQQVPEPMLLGADGATIIR